MKKITHKREKNGSITHVKVFDENGIVGVTKTKEDVINDRNNDYYTYPKGINGPRGAFVRKFGNIITTNPNNTRVDNLDDLSDF